jgi:hypothetical protein
MFNYGRSRMRISKKHSESVNFVYAIPMLFILYLFMFPIVILLNNSLLSIVWASVLFLYLLLVIGFSIMLCLRKKSLSRFILCATLYIVEHFAYGSGLITELVASKPSINKNKGS